MEQTKGVVLKVRCDHCGKDFYKGENYSWDRGHPSKVFHAECLKDKRVLEIGSRLNERTEKEKAL